jgi:hypothetical protein
MRQNSAITLAAVAMLAVSALGDAGVFTGNGQNLRQISSKTIQLVSIKVTVIPGRGRFLFDGTVPGMDQAEFKCEFVLKNLSKEAEEVQVGFPVDSQFAREEEPVSPEISTNWVLEYGFIARDEKTTYHVDFVRQERKPATGKFGSVFVWKMNFAPEETRTLHVQYRIPMSMGLASTRRDELTPGPAGGLSQELLQIAQMEMAGYVTSTGSSWAGNVESATFTVITDPFEKYLNRRGFTEESRSDLKPEEAKSFQSNFPVEHPWWFRKLKPAGWTKVKGGVQWSYKDYKPKDPIEIAYYVTQIPDRGEEVRPFVDAFLKSLGPNYSAETALKQLKGVILATYGIEPTDPAVREFASGQLWYEPRKGLGKSQLSPNQLAVLGEIDKRIAATQASH